MKQNDILQRGEFNVKNLRLIFQWASITAVLVIGGLYLYQLIPAFSSNDRLKSLMIENAKASIGIPLSMIFSTVLVIVFERYSGEIQLKISGFELKGASAPLILWVVCFLAIVTGISILW